MPDEGRIVDETEMHKVGKQIKLPWSKAVEIAIKSMKIRFGRSLVTTASIILAIAFLMSILTSTTLITSLKTEPVRRVIAYREIHEKARRGLDVGLAFPENLSLESTRHRVQELDKEAKASKATADKRLAQAELSVVKLELDVLLRMEALRSAEAGIKALERQLRAPGLAAAKRKEVEAALETRRAELAQLKKATDSWLAKAKAKWVILRTKADVVRAETEWELLSRKLKKEADVEAEIKPGTPPPPRMGFVDMLVKQMDARSRWLALLAALVCFVGIWNAMLMSVHERFREIGTMKCLGALESFIVKLYFLESAFIGMAGTLIGIFIGFLLSMVQALSAFGFGAVFANYDFTGALFSAVGTLLIGSLLSVGAAIFPAMSAAKMDPVVAMRVDE